MKGPINVTPDGGIPYGQLLTLAVIFTVSKQPETPGSALASVTDPNGVVTHPTLTPTGQPGGYILLIDCSVAGTWTARIYAPPGSGQASRDYVWVVDPTANP